MTTTSETETSTRLKVTVVSDYICPWCYIGLEEIERLYGEWDIDLDWAPFFLDPSIPPEGRARAPQAPDAPPSPVELRGETLGLDFRRGRTFTPHTLLALQAGAFSERTGNTQQIMDYHRALFKAYFTDFEDLMDIDVLVKHADASGLDGAALREALESKTYEAEVNAGIEQSYAIGVTGIPTFILNDQYAVVGAQTHDVFERVFAQLGAKKRGEA
ncbi:MAG: DsbA family oxidoreductase [Deltaproteobacteria bacterium]